MTEKNLSQVLRERMQTDNKRFWAGDNISEYIDEDIKEGLISPWILLNTREGKTMLQKMNDEQLAIVGPVIDPQFWLRRFKELPADLELVRDVIKEAKIL